MNEDNEIKSAVRELELVATELKALKKRADEYTAASKRLNGIGEALTKLTQVMDDVPKQYSTAVSLLSDVADKLEASALVVEKSVSTMPDLVQRIETLDHVKAIRKLNQNIESLQSSLSEHINKIILSAMQMAEQEKNLQSSFDSFSRRFTEIETKINGFESAIGNLSIKLEAQDISMQSLISQNSTRRDTSQNATDQLIKELVSEVQSLSYQIKLKRGIFF